ncbi:hypothetical protein GCM10022216_22530 [Sphingobacterium kyonggiense]|uniref:Polysaccharide pyruvyl transferase domain-containing protein n=1 Tax=Sphingobacterium kyonggiense TaxID=714075 RepID=A0ABP7YVK6_9SPHI
MKKINLIYWNEKNFGDLLNPWLIDKLTPCEIQYKKFEASRKKRYLEYISSILKLDFIKAKEVIMPWQKTFICIGSIVRWSNFNTKVWGAGFMNDHESFWGGKIYAVRGRYTYSKLKKAGWECPEVFGDPALLLPIVFKNNILKTKKIGIIPHWKEVDFFINEYGTKYSVIDFRTDKIEKTIEKINECEYILSSSLHGLIVAHAYNIPAIWIKKGYIDTDGFKFKDYFSSVDIKEYDGFENFDLILKSLDTIEDFFYKNKNISLIQNSLLKIQKDLLKSYPFTLKNDYSNYLEEINN